MENEKVIAYYFFVAFNLLFFGPLKAQNNDSIIKVAAATKMFSSVIFFPSATMSYPSPVIGISGSLFINIVEVELGALYSRKFDLVRPPNTGSYYYPIYPDYPSISYVQDYLNFYILANVKLGQVKKHHFSVNVGLLFRKNLSWSSDTLKSKFEHQPNSSIHTLAESSIGVSMIGGFRYTCHFNPKLNLVTGLDVGSNLSTEYYVNGFHTQAELVNYPKPIEPVVQIGLSIGMQFMISKKESVFYSDKRFN